MAGVQISFNSTFWRVSWLKIENSQPFGSEIMRFHCIIEFSCRMSDIFFAFIRFARKHAQTHYLAAEWLRTISFLRKHRENSTVEFFFHSSHLELIRLRTLGIFSQQRENVSKNGSENSKKCWKNR